MPRKTWYFCKHCGASRRFEYIHRRHGFYELGHEDWHCVTCGGCDYRQTATDQYDHDDTGRFTIYRVIDIAWTSRDSTS